MKKLLSKSCKSNSFEGDTLVSTENGFIEIQNITIGELVWSFNEKTGVSSLQEVTHLIVGEGEKYLVDITLETGETITATDEHPFYLPIEKQWASASTLKTHQKLIDLNGQFISISRIKTYTKQAKVYNLTVNNDHTFYVGENAILSHNEGICAKILKSAVKNAKKIQSRAIKRSKGYHGRIPQNLEEDIIRNPHGIYVSGGASGRIIFHRGGDIVVVEGKGGAVGNIITSYGSSGLKGASGAKVLGGKATDLGEAITVKQIIEGKIPMPGGGNLPPGFKL